MAGSTSRASKREACCNHKLAVVVHAGYFWVYEVQAEHTGHVPSPTDRWLPLSQDLQNQLNEVRTLRHYAATAITGAAALL